MAKYYLPGGLSESQRMTDGSVRTFIDDVVREKIGDKKANLLEDLRSRRFWGVLSNIDGTPTQTPAERKKCQQWARKNFTERQLQDLFSFCVRTALNPPEALKDGRPGAYKGHTTLYDLVVDKEGSQFRDAITPEFQVRLNNGRFWENLSTLSPGLNYGFSYGIVEDVLTRHFGDLDTRFAPQGFKLFYNTCAGARPDFNLHLLSDAAVDRYGEFLAALETNRRFGTFKWEKVGEEDIAKLIYPYVREAISRNDDGELRFPTGKTRRSYHERLNESHIVHYLESDKAVRDKLAAHLDVFKSYEGFTKNVWNALPPTVRGLLKEEHKIYIAG